MQQYHPSLQPFRRLVGPISGAASFKAFWLDRPGKRFQDRAMNVISLKPLELETLSMQDLAPLHAALDSDFNGAQRELAEVIFIGLTNSGAAHACSPEMLAEAALAVLVQFSYSLGGCAYYVGKLENVRIARLNRAVRAKFNGSNHAQVARECGISEVRVRQILNPTNPKKGRK